MSELFTTIDRKYSVPSYFQKSNPHECIRRSKFSESFSRSLSLFIYYPLLDWASNLRIYLKRLFSICLNLLLLLILRFATISSVNIILWLQNAYQRKWRLVSTLEQSIQAFKLSFICFIVLRENMPKSFDFDENYVLQLPVIDHLVTKFVTCFAAKLHVVVLICIFPSLWFIMMWETSVTKWNVVEPEDCLYKN